MEPLRSSKQAPAIPERDGRRLARLAREAIAETLGGPVCERVDLHSFDGPGASFVTLTLDGKLRGCVGSPVMSASLVEGVISHARAAASITLAPSLLRLVTWLRSNSRANSDLPTCTLGAKRVPAM